MLATPCTVMSKLVTTRLSIIPSKVVINSVMCTTCWAAWSLEQSAGGHLGHHLCWKCVISTDSGGPKPGAKHSAAHGITSLVII